MTPDKDFYRAGVLVRIKETRNDYPPVAPGQPLRYIAKDDLSLFPTEEAERLVGLGLVEYFDAQAESARRAIIRRCNAEAAMEEANRALEEENDER